jgi:hypothetical protein
MNPLNHRVVKFRPILITRELIKNYPQKIRIKITVIFNALHLAGNVTPSIPLPVRSIFIITSSCASIVEPYRQANEDVKDNQKNVLNRKSRSINSAELRNFWESDGCLYSQYNPHFCGNRSLIVFTSSNHWKLNLRVVREAWGTR